MAAATMACCTLTFRLARARDALEALVASRVEVSAALVESCVEVRASRAETVSAVAAAAALIRMFIDPMAAAAEVAAASSWELIDDMLTARAEDVSARIVETVVARAASLVSTCAARS